MDGLRPMEELSDAANLGRVLKFLPPEATQREFAVDEILNPDRTCLTTVVRLRSDDDGPELDSRILRNGKDWDELLQDHVSPPPMRNEKLHLPLDPKLSAPSKVLLVFFPPELEAQVAEQSTKFEMQSPYTNPHHDVTPSHNDTAVVTVAQPAITRFFGSCRNFMTAVTSFLTGSPKLRARPQSLHRLDQEEDKGVSNQEKGPNTQALASRLSQRQRLGSVPFTLALFRTIVRRMSIHKWIIRLIKRANVPAFERTFTEMPLYSSSEVSMGPHKAIIYNCRTSNEWEDDMALSVTHFPTRKLTFALWFGPSESQQKNIISRLEKAGSDAAHPMLLPGILAELERVRQMDAVDEIINELEEQLTLIGQETVSSWQLSSETKVERNKKKTEAWLNATFSKNILVANAALLYSMRRHLDEFDYMVNPGPARRQRLSGHYVPNHQDNRNLQPEISNSSGNTVHDSIPHANNTHSGTDYFHFGTEPFSRQPTLIEEPESLPDQETKDKEAKHQDAALQEASMEAKYYDALQQASMRMKDRLTSIIGEYDDKVRHCTMEVDGMAMATQWSHGETNMEIATASGEDSSQMRSIALVTMVFLPGTFFASMFSMTFFNWSSESGGDQPIVSSSIWIYVLVTVVFTLITLLLFWYFILSRQRNRKGRRGDNFSAV